MERGVRHVEHYLSSSVPSRLIYPPYRRRMPAGDGSFEQWEKQALEELTARGTPRRYRHSSRATQLHRVAVLDAHGPATLGHTPYTLAVAHDRASQADEGLAERALEVLLTHNEPVSFDDLACALGVSAAHAREIADTLQAHGQATLNEDARMVAAI